MGEARAKPPPLVLRSDSDDDRVLPLTQPSPADRLVGRPVQGLRRGHQLDTVEPNPRHLRDPHPHRHGLFAIAHHRCREVGHLPLRRPGETRHTHPSRRIGARCRPPLEFSRRRHRNIIEVAKLLEGYWFVKPPGREPAHGAEELPCGGVAAAIDLDFRAHHADLIHHQRIDLPCGGQAIEATLGERPVFKSRTPAECKDEMMVVGRGQTTLDSRLDVALDPFLYRAGVDRR